MLDAPWPAVAGTITGVADVASSTADGTTQQAAGNLSRPAAELTALVNEFKY